MMRMLGEEMKMGNAFSYDTARLVLFSMFWRSDKAEMIAKYSDFFQKHEFEFDTMTNPKQFISAFSLFINIGKTESTDTVASPLEE